ncbi:carbohydrate-binding protein [Streptomyces sp. NBC_01017]|uniref:CBM35 domain-containing protein n=1 Tax=Streptomyces sp. NBC_01017 TaxID=2903721 RepID=UPI003869EAC3|nr:carbohydrate-binding protein [Streptomyces sp. NBC_01017]
MTSGNNGASTPEDDDPFGYLYADGQANGAQPPSGGGGYGYPGSVNRVRPVGQRQYGQQAPTAAYGQVPQQQGTYGQPNAHYAAPETHPGGATTASQQPSYSGGHGSGGRGGPNTKGLLIGAIAVVAAVVIGISVAMLGGDGEKDDAAGGDTGSTPTQSESGDSRPSASSSAGAGAADLPAVDAKALRLEGGTATASDFKGSKAAGGVYVTNFNQVGAKVIWSVNGLEKAGSYRLYVRYGIPGKDANATLLVNGTANTQPLNMENFGNTPEGDWEKGWKTTWANVNLNKGTNTIEVACNDGNQCDAVLDQMYLSKGES